MLGLLYLFFLRCRVLCLLLDALYVAELGGEIELVLQVESIWALVGRCICVEDRVRISLKRQVFLSRLSVALSLCKDGLGRVGEGMLGELWRKLDYVTK